MTSPQQRTVKHHHSLRQLLSPARLVESFALQPAANPHTSLVIGLQAALAVSAAALLLYYSAWPEWAGFGSLGALCALYGRFRPVRQRRAIVLHAGALLISSVVVLSALSLLPVSSTSSLVIFALVAGAIAAWEYRAQLGIPGIVIFIFAGSAAMPSASDWQEVATRALATALGVSMALLAGLLTERWRRPAPATTLQSHPIPHLDAAANPNDFWQQHPVLRTSLRVALCTLLAALLAHACGLAHPAWASIGAVAVVQERHLHGSMQRAWQRTFGTLVGAGLAWLILSEQPSFFQILLVVAMLQVITEIAMTYNYGLGQMAVTPMALLMTALAASTDATNMSSARIVDTALGAFVGIALALLFSSLQERQALAQHHHQR